MDSREERREFPPAAALVLAVVAISWGSILVRYCSAGPLTVACLRLALSTLFLAPFMLPRLARHLPPARVLARIFVSSCFLAVHFGAWIWSLNLTSIGSSVVLVSTQPLFSAVLSGAWLGEPAGRRVYAGIAVCLGGTLLISWSDLGFSRERLLGDALALLAGGAGAAYFVIGRAVRREVAFGVYLFLVYGLAGSILAAAALVAGQDLAGFPVRELVPLSAMALIPSLLGHGGLNFAVRHLPAFHVSLATLGEPVLATLYARILFGEPISLALIAGGGLILAGVLIAVSYSAVERRESA